VIENIVADPPVVSRGGLSTLSCLATDSDQDQLEFTWSCLSGSFPEGTAGDTVHWQAPEASGSYPVTLIVSDGANSDEGTIDVHVNESPTAAFIVDPNSGDIETVFSVDADASSDVETSAAQLEIRWDWEDDGEYDTVWLTERTNSHQYSAEGWYAIRLQVRDEEGLTDEETHYVSVGSGCSPGDMVLIPAGTFMMGDTDVAAPVHQVTLTRDYYLSRQEVTNQKYVTVLQWAFDNDYVTVTENSVRAFGRDLYDLAGSGCEIAFSSGSFSLVTSTYIDGLGSWGPGFAYPEGYSVASHPVKHVSFHGAACYCDWLSIMHELEPFYNGEWGQTFSHNPYTSSAYRLPTEAEWEYAARYNDGRPFPWGETTPTCDYANFYNSGWCIGWTTTVGIYPMGNSQLGLENMGGNVFEWVGDQYQDYSSESIVDPLGGNSGTYVQRGGQWASYPSYLHCAYRYSFYPYGSMNSRLGFRIARTAEP